VFSPSKIQTIFPIKSIKGQMSFKSQYDVPIGLLNGIEDKKPY
jgi:hypothetical protein